MGVLSFLHVDPGDGSRVIRLGGKCLLKYRFLGSSSGNPNLADPEENPDFWFFCQHPRLFRFACWTHLHADWLLHSIKTFEPPPVSFLPSSPVHTLLICCLPFHFLGTLCPFCFLCLHYASVLLYLVTLPNPVRLGYQFFCDVHPVGTSSFS